MRFLSGLAFLHPIAYFLTVDQYFAGGVIVQSLVPWEFWGVGAEEREEYNYFFDEDIEDMLLKFLMIFTAYLSSLYTQQIVVMIGTRFLQILEEVSEGFFFIIFCPCLKNIIQKLGLVAILRLWAKFQGKSKRIYLLRILEDEVTILEVSFTL